MKKFTCEELYDLLKEFRCKPALYIGTKSLIKLKHYMDGVLHVVYMDEESDCTDFLKGFQEWIEMKYNISSSHHWSSIINFFSYNEEDAFDSFYKNLDEFLNLNKSQQDYKNIILKYERWLELKSEYWDKTNEIIEE